MRPTRNPAQNAALASLVAPVLAFVLSCWLNAQLQEDTDRIVKLAQGSISLLLILIGFGGAIAALVMMRKHGREGVLVRAIIGLLFNGVILASAVASFQAVRSVAQQRAAVAAAEAQQEQRQKVLAALVVRAQAGEDVSEEYSRLAAEMATELTALEATGGRDGKAMAALGRSLVSVQGANLHYQSALKAYIDAGGLDVAAMDQPGEFDERLRVLDELIAANEAFDQTYVSMPARLKSELLSLGLTAAEASDAVGRLSASARPDLATKMRETDRRLLASSRSLLVLWRDNAGQWTAAPDGTIVWDAPAGANATTQQRIEVELQQAAEEQTRVQQEMLQFQQQSRGRQP